MPVASDPQRGRGGDPKRETPSTYLTRLAEMGVFAPVQAGHDKLFAGYETRLMCDAFRVRSLQCAGDLAPNPHRITRRDRGSSPQAGTERLSPSIICSTPRRRELARATNSRLFDPPLSLTRQSGP